MTVDLSNYYVFMLVMLRMAGMLITSPIFGRRNVPTMLNAGFSLILAVLLTSSMDFAPLPNPTFLTFLMMSIKEFSIGFVAGQIVQCFLSIFVVGGEVVDMQLSISMAKVFDPGTNSSVSLSSNMFNAMFVLIFFATNNHLTLISMTAQTFRIIPLGNFSFNWDVLYYLPDYFTTIFLFAMKLCMPIIVVEIIVTMAVGIIMRVIPQINVFVVNIQFKLLIGFFALIVLVVPFMGYFEHLLIVCTEQIQYVWSNFTV